MLLRSNLAIEHDFGNGSTIGKRRGEQCDHRRETWLKVLQKVINRVGHAVAVALSVISLVWRTIYVVTRRILAPNLISASYLIRRRTTIEPQHVHGIRRAADVDHDVPFARSWWSDLEA